MTIDFDSLIVRDVKYLPPPFDDDDLFIFTKYIWVFLICMFVPWVTQIRRVMDILVAQQKQQIMKTILDST